MAQVQTFLQLKMYFLKFKMADHGEDPSQNEYLQFDGCGKYSCKI